MSNTANYIHALDAYMINNAIGCIKLDFEYGLYVNWLDSFVCTEEPSMKINRLDEATYNKLKELVVAEQ